MAIPPIYKFIAKLIKSNRRLKKKSKGSKIGRKCNKIVADSEKAFAKLYAPKRKKYTHTPEYYRKRLGTTANNAQETLKKIAEVKEAIDLCNKSDEVDAREGTALADAYSLLNLLQNQYDAIKNSTDVKDIAETNAIAKKIGSVKMIIKQLDPKAVLP